MRGLRFATIQTTITGVAGQAALLITGIIAARLLGVEDRGHLAFLYLLVIVTSQAASLGVPQAVVFEIASNPHEVLTTVTTAFRVCRWQVFLGTALNGLLVAVLISDTTDDVRLAGAISIINCGATIVLQYSLAVLQGLRQFTPFNIYRLLPQVGYAGLAVCAAVLSADSVTAITCAWTSATLFSAIGAFFAMRRVLRPIPRPTEQDAQNRLEKRMVGFGARSFLGSSSPVETFRVDQALVGLALSPVALGLYVTALSLTNFPKFLAQSLGMVAYPQVAAQASPSAARRTMWRFVLLGVAVCGAAVVALELLVPWLLPLFFGEEFRDAITLAQILLLSAMLVSVRRVLSDCARGIDRPGAGSTAEVASWIVLAPALAVAATIGVNAVAWAIVAASVVSLAILVALVLRPTGPSDA